MSECKDFTVKQVQSYSGKNNNNNNNNNNKKQLQSKSAKRKSF